MIQDFNINVEDAVAVNVQRSSSTESSNSLVSSLLAKYRKTPKPANSLEEELDRFSELSCGDENILRFWKTNQNDYPKLAKVAKVLLGIPMTSSKSEGAFSTAGCLIRKDRASITPYKIERTLFIHDNYDILKI